MHLLGMNILRFNKIQLTLWSIPVPPYFYIIHTNYSGILIQGQSSFVYSLDKEQHVSQLSLDCCVSDLENNI